MHWGAVTSQKVPRGYPAPKNQTLRGICAWEARREGSPHGMATQRAHLERVNAPSTVSASMQVVLRESIVTVGALHVSAAPRASADQLPNTRSAALEAEQTSGRGRLPPDAIS